MGQVTVTVFYTIYTVCKWYAVCGGGGRGGEYHIPHYGNMHGAGQMQVGDGGECMDD